MVKCHLWPAYTRALTIANTRAAVRVVAVVGNDESSVNRADDL